uniref:Branched-chain amino acid ABC transporter substrate-binding protein n=1 Tax=Geoglobus ahangari TaxID=113653 RepID=A0A7C3UIL6_9EURY
MKRIFVLWMLTLLLVLITIGCVQQPQEETLTIGVIVPETGVFSTAGKAMKNAATLAEEHINTLGLSEYKVKVIFADGGSTPEESKAAFMELSSKADIIVGTYSSDQSVVCAEAAKENKKVFIASVASAEQLEKMVSEGNKYVFRNAYNTSYWGLLAAEFLRLSGAERYYFVGYDPLKTFNQGMLKEIEKANVTKKLGETYYLSTKVSPNDYLEKAEKVTKILEDRDVLVLGDPGGTSVGFVKAYRNAGGKGIIYSVGGVLALPKTLRDLNESYIAFQAAALEDIEKTDLTKKYFEDYKEKFGEEANNYAGILTYDAVLIAAQAWAEDTEKTIKKLETGEFKGASGIYRFNENHQALWGSEDLKGVIGEFVNGSILIVYPENLKTSDVVWP